MTRLARFVLVIALLGAWQAALVHPLAHVDDHGSLVHVGDGHSPKQSKTSGGVCDLLAALTACVASSAAPAAGAPPTFFAPFFTRSAPRAAEAPPFRSQAPPSGT